MVGARYVECADIDRFLLQSSAEKGYPQEQHDTVLQNYKNFTCHMTTIATKILVIILYLRRRKSYNIRNLRSAEPAERIHTISVICGVAF